MTDIIYALSSGHGKSGVAVIRISGPELTKLFQNLTGRKKDITPRHAYFANIIDKAGQLVDKCVAIYFNAPFSFTGEDIIEIHCHGSVPVIEKMFDVIKSYGGRMACPGEFTRRAFDNGKMDLVEVDGLAALLDARTDKQRAHALRTTAGADSDVYMRWRTEMVDLAALSSAMIDYPEDDLPVDIANKIKTKTKKLYDEISSSLSNADKARAIQSGFNIVLVGNVNTGKSSLFNRLVGESRAIVSDVPGTTRDVIHAEIDMDGYLVRLLDTAGLRVTDDYVEMIGIERTHKQIETADLILHLKSDDDATAHTLTNDKIFIRNKSDKSPDRSDKNAVYVSALTGDGIDVLLGEIKKRVHNALDAMESDVAVNARTKTLLMDVTNELAVANNAINPDLFAEHIRRAADAIGRVLGVIGVDEIADQIFGQLCLGK